MALKATRILPNEYARILNACCPNIRAVYANTFARCFLVDFELFLYIKAFESAIRCVVLRKAARNF